MKTIWILTALSVLVVVLLTGAVVYEIYPRPIPTPTIPDEQPFTLRITELDFTMGMPNIVIEIHNETNERLTVSPHAIKTLIKGAHFYDESGREWVWSTPPEFYLQTNAWGGTFSRSSGSITVEPDGVTEEILMFTSQVTLHRQGLIAALMREPENLLFVIDHDRSIDLLSGGMDPFDGFAAHGELNVLWE